MLPVRTRVELDQCQVPGADGKNAGFTPDGTALLLTRWRNSLARGSRHATPSALLRAAAVAMASARSNSSGSPAQVLPSHCVPSTQRAQATLERLSITRVPSSESCMPVGAMATEAATAGSFARAADVATNAARQAIERWQVVRSGFMAVFLEAG